jgi:autotransporter-associated beta strand protein
MNQVCSNWKRGFVCDLWIALVFLGVCVHASAQQRVLGLDVSYWNRGSSSPTATGISQANWNTAYTTPNANGYTRHFVWIRATRGGTTGLSEGSGTPNNPSPATETLSRRYDDPEFLRTVTRSTTAGFFAGAYHYARPDNVGNTGTDEADHMIEYASAYMRPGYLLPILDLEDDSPDGVNSTAQFAIDFSNEIFARMQIRPGIYVGGSRSSVLEGATQSRQDQLAKPQSVNPSLLGPAFPLLWNPRWPDQTNPESIDVQGSTPKASYSGFYGPWDDYGNAEPWTFWQYASTIAIPGIADATLDGDVAHGDIEYVKNYLVPAIWWNDNSGDWSTLTNWNSGQPLSTFNTNDINNPPAPYSPRWGIGQTTPFTTYTLPVPRLPGVAGSGPASTSGTNDTVILERTNASITVTLSSGTYNVRKLYMRETLNITGGSLMVNYNPAYRTNDSADVLHGGPLSAQFSGSVTLSNTGSFTVHTLQVDTNRTFTLAGGTLTMDTINLMPHSTTPAKIVINGNINLNPLSNNITSVIANGSGSGTSGFVDLGGGPRTLTITNGTADVDVSINVPITNGSLTKAGAGTLRFRGANTYAGGTTISAGRLLVNNTSGSGTGTGTVTVNSGGTVGGIGSIAGAVTVNSGGTISPGTSIGTLTLSNAPTLNGTNFMEIDRSGGSPLADKIYLTTGTLTYGGTLVVSNAGAALVGGETFTLFSAPSYAGSFAAMMLPTFGAGTNWFTAGLTTNGTIKVNRRPSINSTPTYTNVAPTILQIPFSSLLTNATDPESNPLSLFGINLTTTNGITLTTNATSVFYSNNVSGNDRFTYTISDGFGGSTNGFVNIVNIGSSPSAQFANSPSWNGSSMTLRFSAVPGWTYYLDRSTNLPVWMTISTNVAPPSGVFDYTDNFQDLGSSAPAAFYRLWWTQ